MRALTALLACLLLALTAWGVMAQAAGPNCNETFEQMAVHVAGDCDEVPADAHGRFPHCHTGCHGHHAATPVSARAAGISFSGVRAYAPSRQLTLTGRQVDRTLRPPQA
jgi:hypothetical protein